MSQHKVVSISQQQPSSPRQYLSRNEQLSPRNTRQQRSKSRLIKKPIYLTDGQISSSDHTNNNISCSEISLMRIQYQSKMKKLQRENKQLRQLIVTLKASQYYQVDQQRIKAVIRQNQQLKIKLVKLQGDVKLLDEELQKVMVESEYLRKNNKTLKQQLQMLVKQSVRQKHNYFNTNNNVNNNNNNIIIHHSNSNKKIYTQQQSHHTNDDDQQQQQTNRQQQQRQQSSIFLHTNSNYYHNNNNYKQQYYFKHQQQQNNIKSNRVSFHNANEQKKQRQSNKEKPKQQKNNNNIYGQQISLYQQIDNNNNNNNNNKNTINKVPIKQRTKSRNNYRSSSKSNQKLLINSIIGQKAVNNINKRSKKQLQQIPSTSQSQTQLKHYKSTSRIRAQLKSRQHYNISKSPNNIYQSSTNTQRDYLRKKNQPNAGLQYNEDYYVVKGDSANINNNNNNKGKKNVYYI